MRIEKINDKQIRCTLNQKDLQERELGLSELAYGTAKAKALFRDMMQQASYEFGFVADDIPLMIEAIPLLPEALILVVTKIEEPDELDTRFSNFTEEPNWETFGDDLDYDDYDYDMFDMEENEGSLLDRPDDRNFLWSSDDMPQTESEVDFIPLPEMLGRESKTDSSIPEQPEHHDIVFIFSFPNLDAVIRVAELIAPVYRGENTLYKDVAEERYFLVLSHRGHTADNLGKICNLLHEYGTAVKKQASTLPYFEEHYQLLIAKNAVRRLANL